MCSPPLHPFTMPCHSRLRAPLRRQSFETKVVSFLNGSTDSAYLSKRTGPLGGSLLLKVWRFAPTILGPPVLQRAHLLNCYVLNTLDAFCHTSFASIGCLFSKYLLHPQHGAALPPFAFNCPLIPTSTFFAPPLCPVFSLSPAVAPGLWRHRHCSGRPDGGRLCGEGERIPAAAWGADARDRAHQEQPRPVQAPRDRQGQVSGTDRYGAMLGFAKAWRKHPAKAMSHMKSVGSG